jgi:hypothetical protein
MEKTGSNTYTLIVTEYMDSANSSAIVSKSGKTPSQESLVTLITQLKARGHKVILKPHVDFQDNTFRGDFVPAKTSEWFDQYREMMNKYAEIAAHSGADILCVGTELKGTTRYADEWRRVIADARSRFGGSLTYAADWTNYDKVSFWDSLDYAGIDAYFPLSYESEPSMAALVDGWMIQRARIDAWQASHGKPLLLTEVGYRNSDDAASKPWAWGDNPEQDDELQQKLYRATAIAWADVPYLAGMQWWEWRACGVEKSVDFSPRNKEAGDFLSSWYSGNIEFEIADCRASYERLKRARESSDRGFFRKFLDFMAGKGFKSDSELKMDLADAEKTFSVSLASLDRAIDLSVSKPLKKSVGANSMSMGSRNFKSLQDQLQALEQRLAEAFQNGDLTEISMLKHEISVLRSTMRADSSKRTR